MKNIHTFEYMEKIFESGIKLKGIEPDWVVSQLREISVDYINFDGEKKDGIIICNKFISQDLHMIFNYLLEIEFPIQSIRPISEFNWDDDLSCSNNNTSCFNYRKVMGTDKLSDHSIGMAIDINPMQNPWVHPRMGNLPKGSKYDISQNGTITEKISNVFKSHGFKWGGDWKNPDYQHFYKNV